MGDGTAGRLNPPGGVDAEGHDSLRGQRGERIRCTACRAQSMVHAHLSKDKSAAFVSDHS